jgi:hypothetical protein
MQVTAVVMAIVILGMAFSLIGTKRTDAAAAAAVQVVNTAANPVPVTGAVTATVNGQLTLEPGASVTVANGQAQPVIVRSAGEPVQGNADCSFTSGSCEVDFVTVPAGKRLVITHVSGSIFLPSPKELQIAQIVHSAGGVGAAWSSPVEYLAPTLIGTPNTSKMLAFNHQTLIRFEPAETAKLMVYSSNIAPGGFAAIFYSGYLEPAP